MINKIKEIYNNHKEIINYLIIGVMTTIVSLGVKYGLLFTVLNANNGVHLQIAIVVSWIAAVLFAYITNRKFVFCSKEKNILKEMTKFFSARLVTLAMESVILWFFITFLEMNSNMWVVIWTLVSQVLILVGNYLLSKLFVFNANKNITNGKLLNKENIYNILMFIILTVICYFFPYTHDDWAWGSQIGIDRLNCLFYNYNGRWLGNLLVMLLTRSRILRTLVVSMTLTLIIYMIGKNVKFQNKCSKYILIILMLLMPVNIIAQSIAWTSGFSNYVIPVLIVLFIMYLNRNIFQDEEITIRKRWILPLLILGFCCSLFMEHMTIYNVLFSISIVAYVLIAKRKLIFPNLFYMIGSISGAVLMFSNGAYHAIANSEDSYRTIEQGNIIIRTINTYFDTFYKLFIQNNLILNIFICMIFLYIIFKFLQINKERINKIKKIILYIATLVFATFISCVLFKNIAGNSYLTTYEKINKYYEGIITILYYISMLVVVFICVENKKRKCRLLFELISVGLIAAPLLIVTPIGPRCFLPTYVFFAMFAIDCFDYYFSEDKNSMFKIFKVISIILITFFLFIYGQIYRIDNKRIKYIHKHNSDKVLTLPKLPYENYMQGGNPVNDTFNDRFKLFYKINKDRTIKFVPYDAWKKEIKK